MSKVKVCKLHEAKFQRHASQMLCQPLELLNVDEILGEWVDKAPVVSNSGQTYKSRTNMAWLERPGIVISARLDGKWFFVEAYGRVRIWQYAMEDKIWFVISETRGSSWCHE